MARKVRCQITKEYGTSDTFYKVGKKYYKSKEIYNEWYLEKTARQELIDIITRDFLDCESGQAPPPILFSEIKRLDFYSYKTILHTVEVKYNEIMRAISNKEFEKVENKVKYIFGIIRNSIIDIYKAEKNIERAKARREVQMENLIKAEDLNFVDSLDQKQSRKRNISKFLREGEDD